MVRNDQRGLTGSVQVALLLPLSGMVLLATLPWGILLRAESTAMAAAQDSARAAAALGASEADGQAAGERAVSNSGIGNVTIAVSRTTGFSNAVVRGAAIRVLPLVDVTVRQEAMVPVERTR